MSLILFAIGCLSIVVWATLAAPRLGLLVGLPASATAHLTAIAAILVATRPLGIDPVWAALLALVAAATVAIAVLLRHRRSWRAPSRRTMLVLSTAATGAVAWIITRALSTVIPGASVTSWAMEGDATNNLHYARRVLDEHGIGLGAEANPVPLPAAIVALALGEHRDSTGLAADLLAYGAVWTVLLAVLCCACSIAVTALVPADRPVLLVALGIAGSLLPLGWLVAGLPIEFGYLNTHIALPLLVAAWLVFLGAERAPVAAIVVLVGIASLLLVTWSPALLIPVALGCVLVVRHHRAVLELRGRALALPALSIVVPVVIAITLTLPALGEQQSALVAPGNGFPSMLLPALGSIGLVVVLAAALRRRVRPPVVGGAIALLVAGYAGTALLIALSADLFDPWNGYYPSKFLWLSTVLLIVVAGSLAGAALATVQHAWRRTLAATGVIGVLAATATGVVIPAEAGEVRLQPAERILGGHVWHTGDAAVGVIVALSSRDEVAVAWDSGSPDEAMINYWTLDAAGGYIGGEDTLRRFSFQENAAFNGLGDHDSAARNGLCRLLRDPAHDVVIYTASASLESELGESCTGSSARYIVGELPGS